MLSYAEENLTGISHEDGRQYLLSFVGIRDVEFQSLVEACGYRKEPARNRPLSEFIIPNPFPLIVLPDGFTLTSLAEECDWEKVHRVLWRGFDHEGDPPMTGTELEERRRMFDTPRGARDLKIAVVEPGGQFVSFCGMFYEPINHLGYVEPVATDPDYRQMGLGKAAVLEGIRRCAALGATVAYVGSDQQFYLSLGFGVRSTSECWL
jgi:GNAT superfamily N-acetyltransferase